jgi:hypothetical protein
MQVQLMDVASEVQLHRQLFLRWQAEEEERRRAPVEVPVVEQTAEEEPQQDLPASVKLEDEEGDDSIDELIERARIVVHRVTRIVTNQLE